jgi:poly(ADP-ribose) glycohydrolase
MVHYNDFGYGVLRVPWSTKNLYISQSGKACRHWDLISHLLADTVGTPVQSGTDLEELIVTMYPPIKGREKIFPHKFDSLVAVVDEELTPRAKKVFFTVTIPWMRAQILRAPSLFPDGIPLLLQDAATVRSVALSQLQVAVLLACSFFCLFPGRHPAGPGQYLGDNELMRHAKLLGYANFGALFGTAGAKTRAKIRCFLQYFSDVALMFPLSGAPTVLQTRIELVRCAVAKAPEDCRSVLASSAAPLLPVEIHEDGFIEDCRGVMQCDFANKVLGGGVLASGCVQEEIRFAVSPELLLSRLLAEALLPHEALIMNGSSQFSCYSGYGSTFAYAGPATVAELSAEEKSRGIRDVCVVALDAVDFAHNRNLRPEYQFFPYWISREVIKAYAAFVGAPSQLPSSTRGRIATGNWGCGAFGGDLYLKFLVQWCAASAAGRPLVYYTFGNVQLASDIRHFVTSVLVPGSSSALPVTAGQLFRALMTYQTRAAGPITAEEPTEDEDELPSSLLITDDDEPSPGLVRHVTGVPALFDLIRRSL